MRPLVFGPSITMNTSARLIALPCLGLPVPFWLRFLQRVISHLEGGIPQTSLTDL